MADAGAQLRQAYTQFLGRDISSGELSWRIGQLGKRSISGQIADIANSQEANTYRTRRQEAGNVDAQALVAQQQREFQALLDKQKVEQEGLFTGYQTKLEGQEKLPDVFYRLEKEAGIPELGQTVGAFKKEIFTVRDLLDRLDEDIATRTEGSWTNESQKRRQIAAEGDPLRTQLGRLGAGMAPAVEALTAAQGRVGQLTQLTSEQQRKELQPDEMRINAVGDRFAREITGFTTNKQNELTALMDKLQRDRALADREWELAQNLAAEERQFERQKQLISHQARLNPGLSMGGGGASAPKGVGNMSQRVDAGFNFTGANGKPVSAFAYAQANNIPFTSLLQQMGSAGDSKAAQMYNWVMKSHGGDIGRAMKTPGWSNANRALTW